MNQIDRHLKDLKKNKKVGLMTHVVVGYPSLPFTEKLVRTLIKAGSDFLELQIPFSDPVADGPAIMQACDSALKNRVRTRDALYLMEKISKKAAIPLLFMAYYNSIFRYGVKKFCHDAQNSGASGLIVPDIPPEEEPREHFIEIAEENNLYPIRIVSPASTEARLKKNSQISKGFVYCVSRFGTTGKQGKLSKELMVYLTLVRKHTSLPLALGFGIHKPEQVKKLKNLSDIIVVGSGIVSLLNKKRMGEKLESKIHRYVNRLKQAMSK